MASENSDEKKFKQCLQLIINTVSDTISNIKAQRNEQQILNDLKKELKNLLKKNLSSLSSKCQHYLLNLFYQYNYTDEEKTLSNSFTKDMLNPFLHDLQGRLVSLDVFQAAWNGDQSIVEDFIQNYPTLKDKSGLHETTLLYSAARNNHFNLVKYLIEIGQCSVNAQNEEYLEHGRQPTVKATIGSTALHAACYKGHLKIVKYLIKHGGDYFILNNIYETPVQNGKSNPNIEKFFKTFFASGYSINLNTCPNKTILQEIEQTEESIIDCIWEYKPFSLDQWFPFASDPSSQLQQSLIISSNKQFQSEIHLTAGRDPYNVSLTQFLRSGKNNTQTDTAAWIRCRGSSLLNFHLYSQWQIMFTKHPTGIINSSSPNQIFDMTTTRKIQLNSWYNSNPRINFLFETAMNYRRKYLNINLEFNNNEKLTFDLENFIFNNEQKTIEGFLRWIPTIISNTSNLKLIDNFHLPTTSDLILLTTSCLKQAQLNRKISTDQINQYDLKYENAFHDDDLDFSYQNSADEQELNKLLNVIQGDLLAEQIDVIVVCYLSKYLVDSVFKAGGQSLRKSFGIKIKENEKSPVISILADGKLASKAVYFVSWKPDPDPNILYQTIEQLISNVIEKAASENYKSIAFPAIGCGEYGCSVSLIAQTFVRQVRRQLITHPIAVLFVIQPDKTDIYEEFRKQINSFGQQEAISIQKPVSLSIGNGTIEVEKGDITKQNVDVIIGSSSSENLRQVLLKAGGDVVQTSYAKERKNNPNSLIISTLPGQLPCKRIFFLKWDPDEDQDILRQSIIDLIGNVIQNVSSYHFTSIAFPAIGCGEHACSVDIVVKTIVREMKQQIEKRKLPWNIKFIIQSNQQNVYDEFCKQLLSTEDRRSTDFQIPSTWERSKDDKLRFIVKKNSDEYKSIANNFNEGLEGNYEEIIKIERIQNERWYMQYKAHSKDFKKRLHEDTEKRLYHGCPEDAAGSIIEDCFNRSFAGVNGTVYGVGVYFSKNVVYSHGYTRPNSKEERCMFLARVLVGKTTLGNSSMKTRPLGFDSTTDEDHMIVTYHDAQAYAEYLITYK